MIDVMTEIYSVLSSDAQLALLLDVDGLGGPAIYTEYSEYKQSPYVVIGFVSSADDYEMQSTGIVQVDIIEATKTQQASYLTCLTIRDRIAKILNKYSAGEGTFNLRVFYSAERAVNDDSGRYKRYAIDFEYRYNRHNDI